MKAIIQGCLMKMEKQTEMTHHIPFGEVESI